MKDVDILHVHFVTVEVGIVGRSARYWGPCRGSLGGMLAVIQANAWWCLQSERFNRKANQGTLAKAEDVI